MPKCINDKTKTYKGTEDSPLGLGYSSSAEEEGAIQTGKDGNLWKVIQTKVSKRWVKVTEKSSTPRRSNNSSHIHICEELPIVPTNNPIEQNILLEDSFIESIPQNDCLKKIDFKNLTDDFYVDVFFPEWETNKKIKEDPFQQKFGGKRPFFTKGESWPLDSLGKPMVFICQFIDPQEDGYLYRIFLQEDNDANLYECKLDKIEWTEETKQKQDDVKKPKSSNKSINYPCIPITNWKASKERVSFNIFFKKIQEMKILFQNNITMILLGILFLQSKLGGLLVTVNKNRVQHVILMHSYK